VSHGRAMLSGTRDYSLIGFYVQGQYWGEMGYFRILAGHNSLGIELEAAWATPGAFTVHNFPCYEDGGNCVKTQYVEDPSKNIEKVQARLAADQKKNQRRD
jgi:hypothetical protein